MGCCVTGEEVKLEGCFTGVLLVPGGLAGSWLARDPGRVPLQRAELSLVERVGGVARSVAQEAEFLLADAAAFFSLLLRLRDRPGSLG